MYMKKMFEVGKAKNGWIIKCSVPIKHKEYGDDDMPKTYGEEGDAHFVAKNDAEVISIMKKLMPLLDEKFSSEDQFEEAFGKAAK